MQEQLEIMQSNVQDEVQNQNQTPAKSNSTNPTCENMFTFCLALGDANSESNIKKGLDRIYLLITQGAIHDCLKDPLGWLEQIDNYIENSPNDANNALLVKSTIRKLGELIIQETRQYTASQSTAPSAA